MNALRTLVLLSGIAAAVPALAETADVHVISSRILVNGKELMAPNVQLLAGKTADISISDEHGKPAYSLRMEVIPGMALGPVEGTGLQTVLWEGPSGEGIERMDAIILLSPAPPTADGPMSAKISTAEGDTFEVQIVSYAVLKR